MAKPAFFMPGTAKIKQVGKGEQTIVSVTANKRVDYELKFLAPV